MPHLVIMKEEIPPLVDSEPAEKGGRFHTAEVQPTEEENKPPQEAPNGGLAAWTQVLGAHLLFFNSWFVRSCLSKSMALSNA